MEGDIKEDCKQEEENHEKFLVSMRNAHDRFQLFYIEELKVWQFNSKCCKYRAMDVVHPKCVFPNTEIVECCSMNCPLSPLPK